MDRRQRLIEIFEDTQRFFSQNARLSKAARGWHRASDQQEIPAIQVK